jgi:hypothetical protein
MITHHIYLHLSAENSSHITQDSVDASSPAKGGGGAGGGGGLHIW